MLYSRYMASLGASNVSKMSKNSYFNQLPEEIILKICSYLDGNSLHYLSVAFPNLTNLVLDQSLSCLWRNVSVYVGTLLYPDEYMRMLGTNFEQVRSANIDSQGETSPTFDAILDLVFTSPVLERLKINADLQYANFKEPRTFPSTLKHLEIVLSCIDNLQCILTSSLLKNNLQTLALQDCWNFEREGRELRGQEFVRQISNMPNLVNLSLKGCAMICDVDVDTLCRSLPRLEILNLSQTNITEESMEYLATLPFLTSLCIAKCKEMRCNDGLELFEQTYTDYFDADEGTFLKYLDLSSSYISYESIISLVRRFKSIEAVQAKNCRQIDSYLQLHHNEIFKKKTNTRISADLENTFILHFK